MANVHNDHDYDDDYDDHDHDYDDYDYGSDGYDLPERVYHLPHEGAELYAEDVGDAQAPALFYLHGGPGYHSHSFRELAGDSLSSYRVLYADQRGAGRSPLRGPHQQSFAELASHYASDVIALLDHAGIAKTSLLAHGFGALIAVDVALRYPERLERLLFVNPWLDMPRLARAMQRHAALLSGQAEAAIAPEHQLAASNWDSMALLEEAFSWVSSSRLLDSMHFPRSASRLLLEHSDAAAITSHNSLEIDREALWRMDARDALPRLAESALPCVLLVGKEDKSCYPEQAELALLHLPQALFSLLDSGHYPWLDDPDTFQAILEQAMQL